MVVNTSLAFLFLIVIPSEVLRSACGRWNESRNLLFLSTRESRSLDCTRPSASGQSRSARNDRLERSTDYPLSLQSRERQGWGGGATRRDMNAHPWAVFSAVKRGQSDQKASQEPTGHLSSEECKRPNGFSVTVELSEKPIAASIGNPTGTPSRRAG